MHPKAQQEGQTDSLRHAHATFTRPALGIRRGAVTFGHEHTAGRVKRDPLTNTRANMSLLDSLALAAVIIETHT